MNTDVALQLVIIVILIAIIVIGNSSLVICICITRQLHNPSSYIVLSLAMADLLVGAWLLPLSIPAVVSQKWTVGAAMCQVNGFTNHLVSSASILGLFVISVDKYISIFYPLRYHEYMTPKRACILISCAWGYALITAIFPLVGWSQYTFAKGIWLCVTDFKADVTFSYFIIFTVYGVPLTFMAVIYFRIFKVAFHHAKAIQQQAFVNNRNDELQTYPTLNKWLTAANDVISEDQESSRRNNADSSSSDMSTGRRQVRLNAAASPQQSRRSTQNSLRVGSIPTGITHGGRRSVSPYTKCKKRKLLTIKKEIRTGLVLSVIVLIFVISWSPFAILNLWALHTGNKTSVLSEALVSRLAYGNSAINPPLYCLMNKVIRKSMHRLWYRVCKCFKLDNCFNCKEPGENEITVIEEKIK